MTNIRKTETQKFDISRYRAAVIGCGGLGSNVIAHLAGAGTGELILCDFDTVSETNLNRQFLYRVEDLGKPKCQAARDWIMAYAPDVNVRCMERKIEDITDFSAFSDCDIIILAVDNALPRRLANEYCRENGTALVCGSIDGFYGMAYLYVPGVSPCLDCAGMTESADISASVSATAGVIGSLEATLAIKYLTGNTSSAGKLLIYDNDEIKGLNISPSCGKCPEHISAGG